MAPPHDVKPWVWYWWLNGKISKEGFTRDFEEMRKHGIAGATATDGSEAGPEVGARPAFMSADWRELFRHAVREAGRCGIALSISVCSGYNAGGPWVTPQHAAKRLVASRTIVQGPGKTSVDLPKPENSLQGGAGWNFNNATANGRLPDGQAKMRKWLDFYRDIAVLAVPLPEQTAEKTGEQVWCSDRVVDLSGQLDARGRVTWKVPPGRWEVSSLVMCGGWLTHNAGSGPAGLEIDPLSAEAMDAHFAETGAKMIADAGPLAGKTLQYLHMDSWEIEGQPTWTPAMGRVPTAVRL